MILKPTRFLLLFLFFLPQLVVAQRKTHNDVELWPELQADYVLGEKGFIYFRNQYRITTNSDLETLYRKQFQLGYEHMFNENWSGGLSERAALETNRNKFFTELFFRHQGHIGSVRFIKRGAFEYIHISDMDAASRFRLRAELDREFKVKELGIRPRVSYEIFLLSSLTGENPENQRRIDRTRLRLDVTFEISDHFSVTPFFTKQTDYLETIEQYDENGNIKIPGGNLNEITPIFGLETRLILFKDDPHRNRFRSYTK